MCARAHSSCRWCGAVVAMGARAPPSCPCGAVATISARAWRSFRYMAVASIGARAPRKCRCWAMTIIGTRARRGCQCRAACVGRCVLLAAVSWACTSLRAMPLARAIECRRQRLLLRTVGAEAVVFGLITRASSIVTDAVETLLLLCYSCRRLSCKCWRATWGLGSIGVLFLSLLIRASRLVAAALEVLLLLCSICRRTCGWAY